MKNNSLLKKALAGLFTTLLFFSSYSVAASESEDSKPRKNLHAKKFYVDAAVGSTIGYVAFVTVDEDDFTETGSGGLGASAALGYQFTDRISLEGGYVHYDYSEMNDHTDFALHGPYIAFKRTIPLPGNFSLFAKLGAIYTIYEDNEEEEDDDDDHLNSLLLPFLGVGAAYSITEHISVNAQYSGPNVLLAGLGMFSAGLTIHF